MKATICQLRDHQDDLAADWRALITHVESEESKLVLLPEMPFYPWVPETDTVDPAVWREAVEAHDRWIERLDELGAPVVTGTHPVIRDGQRLNEGFVWTAAGGYRGVHTKVYLPDEAGFWEASWYEPGQNAFHTVDVDGMRIGFLICTELWFNEHARTYAAEGVHLLVCPRATPLVSVDKWIAAGRTAAVVAGAFCLSSNRAGPYTSGLTWGGTGWLIEPEAGRVLALTDRAHPYVTMDLHLTQAETAKTTYPRYVSRGS